LLAASASLCSCGNSDVVTHRYGTLADARSDKLFLKGWLPDILPVSTHDIVTTNDLDLNTSTGEFSFLPGEFDLFRHHVNGYAPSADAPAGLDADVKQHLRTNGDVSQYRDDDSVWVFLCEPARGHCRYTMWLARSR
jgi:sigma54-dependent transcription regulator